MEKTCKLSVPYEHPCFKDHFSGGPIVPAALLLQWMLQRLSADTGIESLQIKTTKFLHPVLPGDECHIKYIKVESKNSINVRIVSDRAVHVQGKVVWCG